MLVYAATNIVCATAQSIEVILMARAVMGLAAASVIPLCLMSIGRLFPRETRGRLVGLFFSTSFIASVIGIMMSGFAPWRWQFVVPSVLALITVVLIWTSASELGKIYTEKVRYLEVLKSAQLRNILLFIFAISFLYHGVHKWMGVYLSRIYHLKQFAVSFFFMLVAVFGAVGQNVGGYITDKKGRLAACQLGVLVLTVTTMLLYGTYPLFLLGIILALFAVGWTIGHNGISTVLTDFPDETRAELAGLNSSVRFFSGGLGFFLGGPFVEKNFGLTFLGFGVVMFLGVFFLKNIIPNEKRIGGIHG